MFTDPYNVLGFSPPNLCMILPTSSVLDMERGGPPLFQYLRKNLLSP